MGFGLFQETRGRLKFSWKLFFFFFIIQGRFVFFFLGILETKQYFKWLSTHGELRTRNIPYGYIARMKILSFLISHAGQCKIEPSFVQLMVRTPETRLPERRSDRSLAFTTCSCKTEPAIRIHRIQKRDPLWLSTSIGFELQDWLYIYLPHYLSRRLQKKMRKNTSPADIWNLLMFTPRFIHSIRTSRFHSKGSFHFSKQIN